MFSLLHTRASCAHGSFPPKMRAETTHLIPICQITFADAAAHDLLAKTVDFSDCKPELRNVALHLDMLRISVASLEQGWAIPTSTGYQ